MLCCLTGKLWQAFNVVHLKDAFCTALASKVFQNQFQSPQILTVCWEVPPHMANQNFRNLPVAVFQVSVSFDLNNASNDKNQVFPNVQCCLEVRHESPQIEGLMPMICQTNFQVCKHYANLLRDGYTTCKGVRGDLPPFGGLSGPQSINQSKPLLSLMAHRTPTWLRQAFWF